MGMRMERFKCSDGPVSSHSSRLQFWTMWTDQEEDNGNRQVQKGSKRQDTRGTQLSALCWDFRLSFLVKLARSLAHGMVFHKETRRVSPLGAL